MGGAFGVFPFWLKRDGFHWFRFVAFVIYQWKAAICPKGQGQSGLCFWRRGQSWNLLLAWLPGCLAVCLIVVFVKVVGVGPGGMDIIFCRNQYPSFAAVCI